MATDIALAATPAAAASSLSLSSQQQKVAAGAAALQQQSLPPPPPHKRLSTSLPQSSLDQQTHALSARARRRREEAVKRLVADVHRRPETLLQQQQQRASNGGGGIVVVQQQQQQHDWLVASTVAAALERGLDRDLHAELVQEMKDNSSRIGQVCHDHAEEFLKSVHRVVLLGGQAHQLSEALGHAREELQSETAGEMLRAACWWQHVRDADERAQALRGLVESCRHVAVLLDRARKQASLGRPRAALDAVDEARTHLTAPVSSLVVLAQQQQQPTAGSSSATATGNQTNATTVVTTTATTPDESAAKTAGTPTTTTTVRLQDTPFGARAMSMLPKIENEVIMGARRGLNRWFLALRSGGDGAKAGRAVLRKCAHSMAVGGPGQLGLGGLLPPSYVWRSKTADNLMARLDQNGRVARAVRYGFWFERDGLRESERLERLALPGVERRAEAFASAFGWYRCWDSGAPLMVDITDMALPEASALSSSRHGLRGSRHGGGLSGSRHGRKTLGFRASSQSKTTSSRELRTSATASRAGTGKERTRSPWADLLTPSIIFEDAPTRKEDDSKLNDLSESVHPVRRAEQAFNLLGRHEEFIQYYEQNRFGDMKISGGKSAKDDDKNEIRSSLSSLTGDDVSVGTDRIFFAKSLPHLCASVVGFSAVEAALEVGNFADDDEGDPNRDVPPEVKTAANRSADSAARFRDSSARYERALVAELGQLLRGRAVGASLAELARASSLMAAFRSALKIVHPSSNTRRSDKELLAMDVDILMTALKVAQDEQLKATARIVSDDRKEPMAVALSDLSSSKRESHRDKSGVPGEEKVGIPFGLDDLKQKNISGSSEQFEDRRYSQSAKDEFYTFSQSVPQVVRTVHARAIACAAFALSQEELGQVFSQKKGSSGAASYVLDCLEACVSVAAVGMQDSEAVLEEGSVEKAVQSMANIHAVQHSLPRLFGTMMRGMCHTGMIRADQLDETFQYAEMTLKGADKACDAQIGSCYSLVYEICRNKIDAHINYALEGFSWVSKSAREMPNAYCEGLIGYLRSVFATLGPMDEGSRAGLHFSCCGHVAERLVKLLSDPPTDASPAAATSGEEEPLPPIARIDAFGLKNMALDVQEFEDFCDSTGVPQLSECFNELRCLTNSLLDRELPTLLLPENAPALRRKYPLLKLDKLGNILEKYVGMGLGDKLMGGSTGKKADMLLMEKKEVTQLLRLVRSQKG